METDAQRDFNQRLAEREISSRRPEIFRASTHARILQGFASIFAFAAHDRSFRAGRSGVQGEFLAASDEHEDADARFYDSVQTEYVDLFLSHVWDASRWQKALAVYYYANITCATLASFFTWAAIGAACCLWVVRQGDLEGNPLGGDTAIAYGLVYAPVVVFFLGFFGGHHVTASRSTKIWLDKLCIHQTRMDLKELGVSALLEFVGNAEKLVILWDDSYFERLWCSAEVATFCALRKGAENVDIQPLWLAPWVLSTIALDVLSISILNHTLALIPMCGEFFGRNFGDSPLFAGLATQTVGIGLAIGLSYMPAVIPNYISFTRKINSHRTMIRQISEYRFDRAKCTVESDRAIVADHIRRLFTGVSSLGASDNAPDAGPIDRFNHFMQTDFRDVIASRVGMVERIPYRLSCLVFTPLMYMSSADVLDCDSAECTASATAQGYTSVAQYMLTNLGMWSVGCSLIVPTTYPVVLIGLSKIINKFRPTACRIAFCVVWIALAYFYMAFAFGFSSGIVLFAVLKGGVWIAILITWLLSLLVWNYSLFSRKASASQRPWFAKIVRIRQWFGSANRHSLGEPFLSHNEV